MREFFANLMFTMILSALWSLCFEMPFMTIDNILFSGRKQNLSKLLNAYDSTASGSKEICQSKESSITLENVEEINVISSNLVRVAKENCENVAECIKNETEKSMGKIFFINPIKRDETGWQWIPIRDLDYRDQRRNPITLISIFALFSTQFTDDRE